MAKLWKDIKHKDKSPERIAAIATEVEAHCQPGDDCHCSEKSEKTINKLFYEKYSDQFEEMGGSSYDGKIILHFYNPLTDQNLSVSLNEHQELVVIE